MCSTTLRKPKELTEEVRIVFSVWLVISDGSFQIMRLKLISVF